ncbi:CHAD domain-containing protein [Streptomyces sp. NPDC058374]|uniref:CHAD domain-containing protein n=1 Tax=Streptomyces sp. NPDC058374 TaxID=3346466 RepID=UPI00365F0D13
MPPLPEPDRLPEQAPAPGRPAGGPDRTAAPALDRLPGPAAPVGEALRAEAAAFLRALRHHTEAAQDPQETREAARALARSTRRLGATLHTFRPLLDREWVDRLRPELTWLTGVLADEHLVAARLTRLLASLHRLSGPAAPRRGGPGIGAAKAGALLERRLTLARTRAHSACLTAFASARLHALVDEVALLSGEVPLGPDAPAGADALAEGAARRLADAVAALPLHRAGHPYNAEALALAVPAPDSQDTPWHQVRLLLRLHRYAQEVVAPDAAPGPRLAAARRALDRHRDASEAAHEAASAAATPRIAPTTAYALGVLHADQRHEVEAARYAFQRAWAGEVVGVKGE